MNAMYPDSAAPQLKLTAGVAPTQVWSAYAPMFNLFKASGAALPLDGATERVQNQVETLLSITRLQMELGQQLMTGAVEGLQALQQAKTPMDVVQISFANVQGQTQRAIAGGQAIQQELTKAFSSAAPTAKTPDAKPAVPAKPRKVVAV